MIMSRDVIVDELSIFGKATSNVFSGLFSFQELARNSLSTSTAQPTLANSAHKQITKFFKESKTIAPADTWFFKELEKIKPSNEQHTCLPSSSPIQSQNINTFERIIPQPPHSELRPSCIRSAPSYLQDCVVPHSFASIE